jgi:hypothetical protein
MKRFRVLLIVVLALPAVRGRGGEAEDAAARLSGTAGLHALVKVPTRATILKGLERTESEKDFDRLQQWVRELIEAKEKRAQAELEPIKKRVRQEAAERFATEKEKQRRREKFNESWGTLSSAVSTEGRAGGVHLQLDFQVPEIDTYRAAVKVCRARAAMVQDIIDALGKLDVSAESKFKDEEYRNVGALLNACSRLWTKLDEDEDGVLAPAELEAAAAFPKTVKAAVRQGRVGVEAASYRIKPYDADADGALDIAERKGLMMALVEAALRASQDAAFYQRVVDALVLARKPVAAKFADIELLP